MAIVVKAPWFEVDDSLWDEPENGHPWNCECSECSALHELEAQALARPGELGPPADEPVRLVA